MKIEPEINKKQLKQIFLDEYGLEIEELIFIPKGEVALCYIAIDKNNKKYFLKMYPPSKLAEASIQNLDFSLKVCFDLYIKGNIKNISYPMPTTMGSLNKYFGNKPFVLLNYIEGKNQDNVKLSNIELVNVAKLLASIHKSTDMIELKNAPEEKFSTEYKEELIKGLNILEQDKKLDNKYKIKLAKLLVPKKEEILSLLEKTEELSNSIRLKKIDFVICHTDPINLNLIISKKHEVFLIDWDNVRLAPKEQDIWFYLWDNPTLFLDSYKSVFEDFKLNGPIILFYVYSRLLEDLTDWLFRILYENVEEEQNKSDLKGIKSYCLKTLGEIGDYIRKIDTIIKDY